MNENEKQPRYIAGHTASGAGITFSGPPSLGFIPPQLITPSAEMPTDDFIEGYGTIVITPDRIHITGFAVSPKAGDEREGGVAILDWAIRYLEAARDERLSLLPPREP